MNTPLLQVRGLTVRYGAATVLDRVEFSIAAGETVGLVGESGSGKSTLARALLRLVKTSAGTVHWEGDDLLAWNAATLRARRRDLQMVFQDPFASLNPRMTVGDALAEPLLLFQAPSSARARAERVAAMLERVGLSAAAAARYPHQFSGGQCQRIGIARAMMCRPRLLVCDEPVSSLDVSVQGQIVNLLNDLQREHGMAMLFISHNLSVVRHLSHRVLVLYRGRLVEAAPRDALFSSPRHPYTRLLLAAVPARPGAPRHRIEMRGGRPDAPVATDIPSTGCGFYERCPYAQPECARTPPGLQAVAPEHVAACRRVGEI